MWMELVWTFRDRNDDSTIEMQESCSLLDVEAREDDFLKGLGHAISGNFSTDRMVIELTKISK